MLKKNLTMEDFYEVSYIPFNNIEEVLGKRRYKKFMDFMIGSTTGAVKCPSCGNLWAEGVYPCDLANFLRQPNKRFFD
jgi:hypothetical protein